MQEKLRNEFKMQFKDGMNYNSMKEQNVSNSIITETLRLIPTISLLQREGRYKNAEMKLNECPVNWVKTSAFVRL